jgi:hypothetical protein
MLFSFIYWSHLTQIFYLAYQFVNLAMLESLVVNDNKFLKTAFVAEKNHLCMISSTLKILSYNIWFEDLEMEKRTEALGELIQLHSPDVICFQVCHLVSSHWSLIHHIYAKKYTLCRRLRPMYMTFLGYQVGGTRIMIAQFHMKWPVQDQISA